MGVSQCHLYCIFRTRGFGVVLECDHVHITTHYNPRLPKPQGQRAQLASFVNPYIFTYNPNIADIWIKSSKDQRIAILSSQEGNEIEADISRVQEEGGG